MPRRPHHQFDEEVVNTSIRLPKSLLNRAKIQSIHDDITFQALIIDALINELEQREPAVAQRAEAVAARQPVGN